MISKLNLTLILSLIFSLLLATASYAKDKAGSQANDQIPPTNVEVVQVKTQVWQPQLSATGSLLADQGITIKPEISGRITHIFFKSGESLQQNAPLMQINPDILNADLTNAKAQLALSESNLKRARELYQKKVISRADLDTGQTANRSNTANVAKAQALLEQTLIRAPFSGRLGLRLVSLGDFVNMGQPIVNLQALDVLRVDFSIPQTYLSQVSVGQTVIVSSNAYPKQHFNGTVIALDSLVDPTTRMLAVRASIPNQMHQLIPGTFVEITLLMGSPQTIITVPQTSIEYTEANPYVYRVIDHHAVKTPVNLGERLTDQVIITQGLKRGDYIITGGQMKLHDGAPVVINTVAG